MKGESILFLGLGVAVIWLLTSAKNSSHYFDLSYLNDDFDSQDVRRLQELSDVLYSRGLSDFQVKLLLAQALHETGLFTGNPNYKSTDERLNYAGISHGGSISYYNSLDSFVDDWIDILSRKTQPINATSVDDFNNRLKSNGYYTDSIVTYGNALKHYFNLLN